MNDSSTSSSATPPALEIARSIGIVEFDDQWHRLDQCGERGRSRSASRLPVTSRSSETATGSEPDRAAQRRCATESFGRRRSSRSTSWSTVEIRMQIDPHRALPVTVDRSRMRADMCVHRAAFDAVTGHHRVAANRAHRRRRSQRSSRARRRTGRRSARSTRHACRSSQDEGR